MSDPKPIGDGDVLLARHLMRGGNVRVAADGHISISLETPEDRSPPDAIYAPRPAEAAGENFAEGE